MAKRKTTKQLEKTPKPPKLSIQIDAPSGEGKTMQIRTALNQKAVLGALMETRGHVGKACEAANITRDTFYVYMQDPDFAGAVEAIKQRKTDDYIEALDAVALDAKFFPAIKYYLDNHAQDRGYGKEVQAQGAKTINATVTNVQNNLSNLSPELLKQLRQALAASTEK